MVDITIADSANVTTTVQIRDDSALAIAGLKRLRFKSLPNAGDFSKPLNLLPVDRIEAGIDLLSPARLVADATHLAAGAGVDAAFCVITPRQKTLFYDDEFAPAIEIQPDDCWAGLSIDLTVRASITTLAPGFGILIKADTGVTCGTYVHFSALGGSVPAFRDGLATVIENYSTVNSAQKLRAMPVGVARTAELSGSVSLGAVYSAPLQLIPMASFGSPLNFGLAVKPSIDAKVIASVQLSGCFTVRTYRPSDGKLILGVYRKKQTTLAASISASAGIGVNVFGDELLGAILGSAVSGSEVKNPSLSAEDQAEMQTALKWCADQSASIALNACFSASNSDEAAVVYELDLNSGDRVLTDKAIDAALSGDWSALEGLPNVRVLRNIVKELHDRNHKLTIHLLGLYNAASIRDYLRSSTVLHDEHGVITIIDKAVAQKLSAGTTPYAAKSEKLRGAVSQAMVATVVYGATASKMSLKSFSITQSFLEYKAKADIAELTRALLLVRLVDLAPEPEWNNIPKWGVTGNQSKLRLDVHYDARSIMRLFYRNVEDRIPHSPTDLDKIGRNTKIALLDPAATNSVQRRIALGIEEIWEAMNKNGNVATFRLIPGLAKLSPTAIGSVCADFLDIRWWSDAMQSLTPRLTAVLQVIDQSATANLLTDPAFIRARSNLENALGNLTVKTQGAFGDGFGLAVMYRLAKSTAGQGPSVEGDIGWNRHFGHYETGEQLAVGQTGSA